MLLLLLPPLWHSDGPRHVLAHQSAKGPAGAECQGAQQVQSARAAAAARARVAGAGGQVRRGPGAAGAEAGKVEVAKHNALEMSAEQIAAVKATLVEIGGAAGKESGIAAGTEAGSKIDIGKILKQAVEAATKAAVEAAYLFHFQ